MTHDSEVHTLAAPYAMHALPADEVEQFELHLGQCASCREEVDDIRDVAARMGTAETITPPEQMRQQVLDRIATVRPIPPVVNDPRAPASDATPSAWRRWWPRVAVGAAAAMFVVVGALVSVISDQSQQIDDNSQQIDATERLSAEIQRVAAAPDMRKVAKRSPDGGAVVMAARSTDTAVVLPAEMKPAPGDRVYQAWFIKDDDIRSAGTLRDTDDGVRPLAAGGLGDATRVGITVEPEGGSDQPTTDPVMVMDLPA